MATPRTGNGVARVIFFTTEVSDALVAEAMKQGKSSSKIVRDALIPYLMMRGYSFSEKANPSGRGERTDLYSSSSKSLKRIATQLSHLTETDESAKKLAEQREQSEQIEKLDKELRKLNMKIDKKLKDIDESLAKLGEKSAKEPKKRLAKGLTEVDKEKLKEEVFARLGAERIREEYAQLLKEKDLAVYGAMVREWVEEELLRLGETKVSEKKVEETVTGKNHLPMET